MNLNKIFLVVCLVVSGIVTDNLSARGSTVGFTSLNGTIKTRNVESCNKTLH